MLIRNLLILQFALFTLHVALPAQAQKAACWDGRVAALDSGRLYLTDASLTKTTSIPAKDVITIIAGRWQGKPALLAARGKQLLRLNGTAWAQIGTAAAPILQILPTEDATDGAVLLTGTAANPAPKDSAVWWATWGKAFAATRLALIGADFRPWQLWWTQVGGERRLAVATYKKTPYVKFLHNCMFVYAWNGGKIEARWLGSRLSRPYVSAAHAQLRSGDRQMVAVEVTKEGGRALSVYKPVGFGYEGTWHTQAIAGLQRLASCGPAVLCLGKTQAWQLVGSGEGYRLLPLSIKPPSLDVLVVLDNSRLVGHWGGKWQCVRLPQYSKP